MIFDTLTKNTKFCNYIISSPSTTFDSLTKVPHLIPYFNIWSSTTKFDPLTKSLIPDYDTNNTTIILEIHTHCEIFVPILSFGCAIVCVCHFHPQHQTSNYTFGHKSHYRDKEFLIIIAMFDTLTPLYWLVSRKNWKILLNDRKTLSVYAHE